MARAKRTTRAEARRRYRAEHGLPDEAALDDEPQDAGPTSAAAAPRRQIPDLPPASPHDSASRLPSAKHSGRSTFAATWPPYRS